MAGPAISLQKLLRTAAVILGVFAASTSSAAVLLLEDFDGVTISDNLTINLLNNPGTTSDDNLDQWIDFPNSLRWGISSGCTAPCDGSFAQHLVQASDNTNLLFYGLSGASVAPGTVLTLNFDFISSNRAGTAYLAGMMFGVNSLDPYAPWFEAGGDDGDVLASTSLFSGSWTSGSLSYQLTQAYDVYVIAFAMGGTTGMRGIDNVSLTTNVPEPGTLALLGLGLAGLGLAKRRKLN